MVTTRMTQAQALDILKLGHNVFLTGAAGSGKTFLLNSYINYLKKREVAVGVTASTGIAATHMNGVTVHSWSGLGIRDELNNKQLYEISKKSHVKKRFAKVKVLIIDEVSMLHDYRLDLIDHVCRYMKKNPLPFGGLQIILCGDFFQLPPVSREDEAPARFAYKARVWQKMDIKICYLNEQYRQSDQSLLDVLNAMRNNAVNETTLNYLRACYKRKILGSVTPTKLYTHNCDVDAINNRQLAQLKGATKLYQMQGNGNSVLVENLQKSCLAPQMLRLKVGAAVMFVKNNFENGYVNGTLGDVVGFDENKFPIIKTISGRMIYAKPESWQIEEDGFVKASIRQIPVRLAWAITVHKSQGMSLDAAEIDLSKSFEPGMGYVALSRVRTLAGLRLVGLNDTALQVSEEILQKDKELLALSQAGIQELRSLSIIEKIKKQTEYLNSITPTKAEQQEKKEKKIRKKRGATYEVTKELLSEKKSFAQIADERGISEGTIMGHVEKLLQRGDTLSLNHITFPEAKLAVIQKAFVQTKEFNLTPVYEFLAGQFSYNELRLARVLLISRGVL
ncbi:MAG: AAA family ATPase [bacterium]|nr:AAA family ATPase [bacterium]